MSRVGRKVIPIPKDVKVQIETARCRSRGPRASCTTPVPPGISFKLEDGELHLPARATTSGSSAPSTAWRAPWPRTPSRA